MDRTASSPGESADTAGRPAPDPRKLVGLLADERRLKVAAAVALGAATLDAIAAMSGLDRIVVSRCLGQLEAGGLIESVPTVGYRFLIGTFRSVAGGRSSLAGPDPLRELAKSGRLPRSRPDRLVVLEAMAGLFGLQTRYPEVEVNTRLRALHPDFALLRRSLVDAGLLKRANEDTPDGRTVTVYWRTEDH
jgi:hypothetical protein